MKLFLLLSAFIFTSFPAFSIEESQLQAKAVMGEVYGAYVKIIPYIYSPEKLMSGTSDANMKKDLIDNLTNLAKAFKNSKHDTFFQRPGLEVSHTTISGHLDETVTYISSGNFIFAQKRLQEIGSLCISCHTQLPKSVTKNAFGDNVIREKRELFDSDYAYANYLYLIRQFDESKKYFEKTMGSDFSKTGVSADRKIISSLRRMVSIDTKINFNYAKAKELLDKWSADKRVLRSEKGVIKAWSDDLTKWKDFKPTDAGEISAFIEKNLKPLDLKKEQMFTGEKDMTLLISSGVLFNYLIEKPETKLAPEILYWLSFSEKRLSLSHYFSLGDTYLKDCIRKYPESPFARKCYAEYADSIEAGYSGSSGTNIPKEEKDELNALKSLIDKKAKK
jgi:hypothetical protein